MAGRKVLTYGGLGAAAASAYYLYNAGGDAKLAEKKFERRLIDPAILLVATADIVSR